MRVSAKVDYAVRAGAELAAASGAGPVKGDTIARAQDIPLKFLENILLDLKYAGPAEALREVWIAVRGNLRAVLETVTLADVAAGELPDEVRRIASDPD